MKSIPWQQEPEAVIPMAQSREEFQLRALSFAQQVDKSFLTIATLVDVRHIQPHPKPGLIYAHKFAILGIGRGRVLGFNFPTHFSRHSREGGNPWAGKSSKRHMDSRLRGNDG